METKQHIPEQPIGQRINQEQKKKKILKQMKMETQHTKSYEIQQKHSMREVHSSKCLH